MDKSPKKRISRRPLRPCLKPGCRELVKKGYCYRHKPVKLFVSKERESAAKRGYDRKWRRFREYYLRKNPVCVKCKDLATMIHHIEKLPKGSKYGEENLQALCASCHNLVHKRLKQ
jgi:5-methylcytosine-specific restriction protein A